MSDRQRLLVLLAAERSGTHFLRSVMDLNGAGGSHGEVANAEVTPERGEVLNFFSFREKFLTSNPDGFFPSVERSSRLINRYLDHCKDCFQNEKQRIVLDIKYGHVVNFAGGWWDLFSRPLLFDIVAERHIPVVHLIRRRVHATALSAEYARSTGVWRAASKKEIKNKPINISRERLIDQANMLTRSIDLARNWLIELEHIEVYYEELLYMPSPSWQRLSDLVERNITKNESYFFKTTPDPKEIVENYDEIQDLINVEIV